MQLFISPHAQIYKSSKTSLNMVRKTYSQKIKSKARQGLNRKVTKDRKNYVVDTSVIVNKFMPGLLEKGLKGKIIIPNTVIAELENLANKGKEAGFVGLDEIASLHKLTRKYSIYIAFVGQRPDEKHIKYAKSGEIDALIRELAFKNKATLITADLVQAKSAQAYGISVIFIKPRFVEKKKRFFSFLGRR